MIKKIDQFLKKCEKFLELDVRYFSKNSFFLLAREISSGFFGFLLTLVIARQFSLSSFGEYNLALSLLGVLSIFSLPGMMDSILISSAKGFDHSLIEGTRLRIKSSFLAIPVILALSSFYYFYKHQPTVGLFLFLAIPIFPFYFSFKTYDVFLIAKEKFKKLFFTSLITALISALFVSANTLIFKKVYLTFLSFIFINSLADLFFYFQIKSGLNKTKNNDRGMKPFGYFISLISVLSLIVNNLDKVILNLFSDLSSVAVFSIAATFPQFVERALRSLDGVLIPKIIKQGVKGNQEMINKHFLKTVLISFLITLPVFLFAPFFINLFFSEKYKQASLFVRLLSLPILFQLPSMLLSKIIIYQKRLKQTLFLSFCPEIIKFFCYFLLIPKFKILGLVLTILITKTINFFILLFLFFKKKA